MRQPWSKFGCIQSFLRRNSEIMEPNFIQENLLTQHNIFEFPLQKEGNKEIQFVTDFLFDWFETTIIYRKSLKSLRYFLLILLRTCIIFSFPPN